MVHAGESERFDESLLRVTEASRRLVTAPEAQRRAALGRRLRLLSLSELHQQRPDRGALTAGAPNRAVDRSVAAA